MFALQGTWGSDQAVSPSHYSGLLDPCRANLVFFRGFRSKQVEYVPCCPRAHRLVRLERGPD